MNVQEQKNFLRQKISLSLRNIPGREERTAELTRRALSLVEERKITSVALYLSVRDELSTSLLLEGLLARNLIVSVPVVTGDGKMIFSQINSETAFRKGAFGIPEPAHIVPVSQIDLIFVPLIAFDDELYRLGHGKGYYDRFFAAQKMDMEKIGLAFSEQKVPSLPHERTDVPLDDVLYV